jgi:hypothetical protein
MGLKADLNTMKERKISCSSYELKHDSLAVQPVVWPLYRVRYMLHIPLLNNIHLISHLSFEIFFIRKLNSVHCYIAFILSNSSILFHSPVGQ